MGRIMAATATVMKHAWSLQIVAMIITQRVFTSMTELDRLKFLWLSSPTSTKWQVTFLTEQETEVLFLPTLSTTVVPAENSTNRIAPL